MNPLEIKEVKFDLGIHLARGNMDMTS